MVCMDNVPRSEQFDDVYFSREDGAAETAHVFLDGNNLPAAWQGRDRFTIAETGFGTGLNFLLAWDLFQRTAERGAFLDFVSVEKFPLSAEQIREGLSFWAPRLEPYLGKMLQSYPIRVPGFHRIVFDSRVALTLIFGDANDVLPEVIANVDAWFLDGFTPSKNPDMWTEKVFGEMARLSHGGTTFATFTAAGFVKRGLRDAGFLVEKKKGFGSKRDMLAGTFEGKSLQRASSVPDKKVHIVGAGLAGCASAYVLNQYGFEPALYDPNGIASGASGNDVGLINPRFTAFRTAESDFYTAGFAQTVRSFSSMSDAGYKKCGSLHLITNEDKERRLARTAENWGWNDAHMRVVNSQEVSELSGVTVDYPALYLPDSGQINPKALCHFYAHGIELQTQSYRQGKGDTVILANGVGALEYVELPIDTVRGQVTYVAASEISGRLKTNLCYGGYVSAELDGKHAVGSTFQKWLTHTDVADEDDQSNLESLASAVPDLKGLKITGHRAALRTSAKDRFPVIGPVGDVYVSTAHGSHGIVSTLAGAHLLADCLRGGPFSLGKSTIEALSSARFRKRS